MNEGFQFICDKCGKIFKRKYHLTRHSSVCKIARFVGPATATADTEQFMENDDSYGIEFVEVDRKPDNSIS